MAFTARTYRDYVDMFALTDQEIQKRSILDCGAGASPFGAQVRMRGGQALSADPAYGLSRSALRSEITRHYDLVEHAAAEGLLEGSRFGPPPAFRRYLDIASDFFLEDFRRSPEYYITAALPNLPFPDGTFELTLISHVLFNPLEFSLDDHFLALIELARVTSGAVRVFPLVSIEGIRYEGLEVLADRLRKCNLACLIRSVEYEDAAGGTDMLEIFHQIDGSSTLVAGGTVG